MSTFVARFFSEPILCGNILYTRSSLYRELVREGGTHRMADYFAFRGEPLTPEQVREVEQYWQGVPPSVWDHRR
jgi:hypothetical protein